MKKLILFTLLCASILNGMENPEYFRLGDLPTDAKAVIIASMETYDNLDDIIYNIKKASLINWELNTIVNKMYGHQKGFAALMHILADKFGESTESIAKKFGTPAAQVYLDLAEQLNAAIGNADFDTALQLIKEGADVNYPAELVIHILINSKDVDDAINALEEASKTNQQLNQIVNTAQGNQKGFSALVQILAKRFDTEQPVIAKKFNTPASKEYMRLAIALLKAIKDQNSDEVVNLLMQGADVNYYTKLGGGTTALSHAILFGSADIVKLLLDAGANPHFKFTAFKSNALEYLNRKSEALEYLNMDLTEKSEKEQLLKKAMGKQQ